MRVLLVHNLYRVPGGEETYYYSLADLLKKRGHKVVAWTRDNRIIDKSGLFEKVKLAAGMYWNSGVYKELSDIIKRFKPDVAHFNNIFPLITPTAYHVCKKFDVSILQTIHNYRFMFPKSILFRRGEVCELCLDKRFIYPAFLHKCYGQPFPYTFTFSTSHALHSLIGSFDLIDIYIFPSEFTRTYYTGNTDIDSKKTRVIPNFVDIKPPRRRIDKKDDYFLYVGRLSEEKGVLNLLQAFASLPDVKLIVIGDGPLRKKVNQYRNNRNIVIKGSLTRKKIFEYMRKALFTVVPSEWYEVLPTVVLESFANGTPVIVPRLGAFKEIVEDKKNGIFFKHKNSEDLTKVLIEAVNNKKLANRLAFNARREAIRYTPGEHYSRLVEIYASIANKPKLK